MSDHNDTQPYAPSPRLASRHSLTRWCRPALVTIATFGLFACSQPNGTPSKSADTAAAATQAEPASTTSASQKPFAHVPAATRKMLQASKPVSGKHGMVASSQHYATEIGLKILKQGGNAIDAAVAVGYAEAVTNPCCGNIGGGGFMTIHLANGKNVFLNFREKAPLKATVDMFQNDKGKVVKDRSLYTYKGVGVPGTVMGLNTALKKYGTMSLEQVIQPAIDLARNGFILEKGDTDLLQSHTEQFAKHENVADIFLKDDGKPYQPGDKLVQENLAHSLELIKKGGTKAFYEGSIAKTIVKASNANDGLLSMKDFADYNVTWEKPVTCEYHGYKIVSAPPPSSGGTTMCMILRIMQPYPVSKWGFGSVKYVHYLAEAERRAFANRNKYLGDPAFVDNPIDKLLSDANIDKLRSSIKPNKATPSSELDGVLGAPEGTHTTHYSVADSKGNAVAVTYTINYLFGIGQIAGDTGFFLNDEMDDFTAKPGVANGAGLVQGVVNRVEPGKRPLSSMTPTLVMKDGKPFMLTGSPGSATIISTTLQTIINVVDFGMNVQQAVDAPRIHQQWLPQVVYVEPGLLTDQSKKKLEAMGYTLKDRGIGDAESIVIDPKTGVMYGANDERRSPAGSAAGY